VHQCDTVPVEIIVRAYITGTAWRNYLKGEHTSGIMLPKGLKKNQKLDEVLITPSTKAETGHDIYISKKQIIKEKMVDKEIYEEMETAALKLFGFGQKFCEKNGLIMVDTKYEFGIKDEELIVIDEIHTQDSSRFWILDSYEDKFQKGEDPEILDKEIFRGWLMNTYPDIFPDIKPDDKIPPISEDIRIELAKTYMRSYEKITGLEFKAEVIDVNQRILVNLHEANYL
ncbi:MAG: phosphoribosylaminoimidazolesuccinocarboxamide synthase, partial [Candidatus Thorarchaeota archaeon]